jgi:Big-like domain-containing protein
VTRRFLMAALCVVAAGCSAQKRSDATQRQHERNLPSMGYIDIPASGATVDATVRVSGWALDESGVKLVRIYFDDELMVSVPLVSPRPDVDRSFPRYSTPDKIHGFEALIDAGSHVGYTLIRAEAIDGKGAATSIYSVSVKIRE